MTKDTFDAIVTSTPLNSTAARVTASGVHYQPESKRPPGMQHWDAPPPMKPFIGNPSLGAIDLTGKRFGRFTVVGLLAEKGGKNRGDRWVCRCTCGDYEARQARTIKSVLAGLTPENSIGGKCWNCVNLQTIQGRYKKKGGRPLQAFVHAKGKLIEASIPETIIADEVAAISPDKESHATAIKIIASLNRKGYRIVRDPALKPQ